jgi:hypothetical protein
MDGDPADDALVPVSTPLPEVSPSTSPPQLPEFSDHELGAQVEAQLRLLDNPDKTVTPKKDAQADAIGSEPGQPTSLFERTQLGLRHSFWTSPLSGQVLYSGLRTLAEHDVDWADTYKKWVDSELLKYDLMPGSSSASEYGAALLGGFLGGIPDPSNLILLGGGPIVGGGVKEAATRIASAGARVGAFNQALDAPQQVLMQWNGLQKEWDWGQTALAFPSGFLMGAGLHTAAGEAPVALLHALRATTDAAADDAARIVFLGQGAPMGGRGATFLEEWRPTSQTAEMADFPGIPQNVSRETIGTEATPAGQQGVIPGAERIGQGEQAQRGADSGLKPKAPQKPMDEGLFGDDSKQIDLIDEIAKKGKPPQTFTQFVRTIGGIKNDSDIATIYGQQRPDLVSKNGKSLNEIVEAAREAGYLTREGDNQVADAGAHEQVRQMLDDEERHRVGGNGVLHYPGGAEPPAGRDMHLEQAQFEVTAEIQGRGYDTSKMSKGEAKRWRDIQRRATEHAYAGADAADAVDLAIMEVGHVKDASPKVAKDIGDTVMRELLEGDVFFARPGARAGTRAAIAAGTTPIEPNVLTAGVQAKFMPGKKQRSVSGVPDQGQPLPAGLESVRTIITTLSDELGATLREGHVMMGALGHYDMRQMAARAKNVDDIEVVTHELGHHIDALLGKALRDVIRAHEAEMRSMVLPGYDVERVWKQEGFAEFARTYVTNRNYATSKAPGFARDFRTFMEDHNPDVLAALDKAATAWQAFLTAPSGAVTRDFVVTWRPPGRAQMNEGLKASIDVRLGDMYTATIDRVHPIERLKRNLLRLIVEKTGAKVDLGAENDPSALMRVALQPQTISAHDVRDGMTGYRDTAKISAGLREIMTLVAGKPNVWGKWDDTAAHDFSVFLVAREAEFRYGQYTRGEIPNPPTGFVTLGDWQTFMREVRAQYPQFDQAATMFDGFRQAMWKLRFDSGQIGKDTFERGLNNPHHVPFWRDMSEDPTVAKRLGLGTPTLEQSAVKKFRGSSRPVLDVVQSTVKEIADLRAWIAINDTVKALKSLAQAAARSGREPAADAAGGRFIEVIRNTNPELKAKYTLDQALDQAAREQGVDPAIIAQVKASLGEFMSTDTAMAIFQHAPIRPGKDPILFGWDGGERFALRLNDVENARDVFNLIANAQAPQRDMALQAAGFASQIMRAGTVTDPTFAIGNIIRDTMGAWALHGGVPFQPMISGFLHYLRNDEIAQMYGQVGGRAGGVMLQQLRDLRATREFQAMAQNGRLVSRFTSFRALWENITAISEISETATRLGIFEKYYKRNLELKLDKYTAAFRAMNEAVDTMDFSRHGSRTSQIMALVPFLNANMVGLDKNIRSTVVPWVRAANGGTLTRQDQAVLKRSAGVVTRVAMMAVGSVALRALYSNDPEYEEISDYLRATHWMVKVPWLNGGKVINALGQEIDVPKDATGVWVAIPKPFEWAVIPNAAERAFEALALKDPTAAKRWAMGALSITSPPNPLQDIPIVKNFIETKLGYDLFTNAPIVPEYLKGLVPQEQYTARTSDATKAITRVLNKVWPGKDWSPIEVDHVITGFGSTWGRDLLALFDVAAGKEKGWQDWPMFRRYMREVTRGSVSGLAFWDLVSQSNGRLEQAAETYKTFLERRRPNEPDDFFAKLDPAQKAYIALKLGDHYKADDKRLHPLIRAHEAMTVLTGMRRQVADNNIVSEFGERAAHKLTGSQQKMLEQELGMLSMLEARNALIAAKEPGWEQKQIVDPTPTYDVIREISPEAADELAARFASHKVYRQDATAAAWPKALDRLGREGTEASLSDLRGDVRAAGYEMGAYRQRKARLPRASLTGADLMRVP